MSNPISRNAMEQLKKKYRFHSDPGHGWLEVTLQELFALGIYDKISRFSYEKEGTIYLEEDCDAHHFCKAYEEENDEEIDFVTIDYNHDAPSKSYARFQTSHNRN